MSGQCSFWKYSISKNLSSERSPCVEFKEVSKMVFNQKCTQWPFRLKLDTHKLLYVIFIAPVDHSTQRCVAGQSEVSPTRLGPYAGPEENNLV